MKETLQACTSISVSKLCNFHLPYLVTFVNKLVFCFPLPKFTSCLFVSWGRPQFSLFYHNLGPLLHLQYMKTHADAFSKSRRCGKNLSFATLVTHITVLGAEQFALPCKVVFAKLQLKKFWAWAATKNGLCWGRITAKAFDKFQRNWIFYRGNIKQKHQSYCVGHTIKVMFFFMFPQ